MLEKKYVSLNLCVKKGFKIRNNFTNNNVEIKKHQKLGTVDDSIAFFIKTD